MVEQFGKYKIVQEIGRGGFATVYQAQDTSLGGRPVALKLLSPAILHDPTFIQRFQREAETAAGLRHPHIITVYETGEVNSVYYLAMDYVAGGSLRDYLRQKKALPWSECAHILEQICSALAYAHERGVIHRDLKPANILIDPETGAIVTDFGFARLMGDSSQSLSSTGSGVLGTPAYIPVEVWEGKKGDHTSDIYALGCMLYEMLTGQLLFTGDTPIAIMRNHDQGAQLPAQWPAGTPAGVGQIIRKATAKTPAERYGSVRELWQAVQQLSTPEVAPRPVATSTLAVPWAWLAAGGTVLALLLLLGVWLLGGRGTEKDNMESTIFAQTTQVYATNEALKAQNVAVTQTLVALSQVTPPSTPTFTPTPSFTPTFTPTATKTNTLTPTVTPTLTSTPINTPEAGTIQNFALPTGLEVPMAYVPAGPFMMGSNDGATDEQPVHEVFVDSFWIDVTEVTNEQFALFVADTEYVTTAEVKGGDFNWRTPFGLNSSIEGKEKEPVVQMSWNDAVAFCEWRGIDLPTEAQWEKAARGIDERIYPWGNVLTGREANFCDANCPFDNLKNDNFNDGQDSLAIVGSYSSRGDSPYGAQDMAGNVWEWTKNNYTKDYSELTVEYENRKVIRGGSWDYVYGALRTTNRNWSNDSNQIYYVGFRCATQALVEKNTGFFLPTFTPTPTSTPFTPTPTSTSEFLPENPPLSTPGG